MSELCYACGACLSICPTQSIEIIHKERGAPYYKIGENCIHCGKCVEVCPIGKDLSHPEQNKFFRAVTKHKDILCQSSSGGLAYEIAKSVILEGGVVYGAGWDARGQRVRHMRVDAIVGLAVIQGSKYVQSLIEPHIYQSILKDLDRGRVLMTGCPCQIAAVRMFADDHPNLLSVDLICHGVPSAKLLDEQLNALTTEKIENISFRKGMRFVLNVKGAASTYSSEGLDNPYYSLFLHFASLREGCYVCKFANIRRIGDITLGDYIENNHSYSCVVSNTAKGDATIQLIKNDVEFSERDIRSLLTNHAFTRPTDKHPQTNNFTRYYEKYGLKSAYYIAFSKFIVKRRLRKILGESAYGLIRKLFKFIG